MQNITKDIKSNLSILEDRLKYYGANRIKSKTHYSCVHCTSSDGLSIKKANNTYKCFSCGTGGTVIDLIKEKENLDFIGAIKHIASIYGIQLPKKNYTDEEKEKFKKLKEDKLELEKYLYKLDLELKKDDLDINKKFEISCLKDKLENKEANKHDIEVINHSNYRATETIEVNKYISESRLSVINCISSAMLGDINLLIAPTGSGKSHMMINTLKDLGIKTLFILPNASNVQQAMNKYSIGGAYGDLSVVTAIENNNIVAMTWNKTKYLKNMDLSEYIIVIDEIHQTFTDLYRAEAIKDLYDITDRCKGRIDITATPNKLDFRIYNNILEFKQMEQTQYNVKMYNGIDTAKMISIISNSNKSALLMDSSDTLKFISKNIDKKNDLIISG